MRVLFQLRDIKKGEVLSYDNIWVKRPGTGSIMAKDLKNVLGKIALVDIPKDTQIDFSSLD